MKDGLPRGAFAFAPSPDPDTWRIPYLEADGSVDPTHLDAAAAGIPEDIPADYHPMVRAKLRQAYRRGGLEDDIPEHLHEADPWYEAQGDEWAEISERVWREDLVRRDTGGRFTFKSGGKVAGKVVQRLVNRFGAPVNRLNSGAGRKALRSIRAAHKARAARQEGGKKSDWTRAEREAMIRARTFLVTGANPTDRAVLRAFQGKASAAVTYDEQRGRSGAGGGSVARRPITAGATRQAPRQAPRQAQQQPRAVRPVGPPRRAGQSGVIPTVAGQDMPTPGRERRRRPLVWPREADVIDDAVTMIDDLDADDIALLDSLDLGDDDEVQEAWSVGDVDRHHKGLTDEQKRQWVHVANGELAAGASDGEAIRKANAVVSDPRRTAGNREADMTVIPTPRPMPIIRESEDWLDAAEIEADLAEKSSDDHFYGAWHGGSRGQGGGPGAAPTKAGRVKDLADKVGAENVGNIANLQKGGDAPKEPRKPTVHQQAKAAAKRDAATRAGDVVSPDEAIAALEKGERPHIAPEGVKDLLAKTSQRSDHLDLTEVQVAGTLKFGGDGMGIARADMPQLPGDRLPAYLDRLRGKGVQISEESIDPQLLHPMQREVSATKVGKMLDVMRAGTLPGGQIVITRDNYVLDGHHRWGAATALGFERQGVTVDAVRIGMDARPLLKDALSWTAAEGIKNRALNEAGSVTDDELMVALQESAAALADALATLEEASGSDHYYGAWKGGSKASGGHPMGGGASEQKPTYGSKADDDATRKALHDYLRDNPRSKDERSGPPDSRVQDGRSLYGVLDRNHHPGGKTGVDVSTAAAKYRDRTVEPISANAPGDAAKLRAWHRAQREQGQLRDATPQYGGGPRKAFTSHGEGTYRDSLGGHDAPKGTEWLLIRRDDGGTQVELWSKSGKFIADATDDPTEAMRLGRAFRESDFEEKGDDHFYGAWHGGSRAAGGGPGPAPGGKAARIKDMASKVGPSNVGNLSHLKGDRGEGQKPSTVAALGGKADAAVRSTARPATAAQKRLDALPEGSPQRLNAGQKGGVKPTNLTAGEKATQKAASDAALAKQDAADMKRGNVRFSGADQKVGQIGSRDRDLAAHSRIGNLPSEKYGGTGAQVTVRHLDENGQRLTTSGTLVDTRAVALGSGGMPGDKGSGFTVRSADGKTTTVAYKDVHSVKASAGASAATPAAPKVPGAPGAATVAANDRSIERAKRERAQAAAEQTARASSGQRPPTPDYAAAAKEPKAPLPPDQVPLKPYAGPSNPAPTPTSVTQGRYGTVNRYGGPVGPGGAATTPQNPLGQTGSAASARSAAAASGFQGAGRSAAAAPSDVVAPAGHSLVPAANGRDMQVVKGSRTVGTVKQVDSENSMGVPLNPGQSAYLGTYGKGPGAPSMAFQSQTAAAHFAATGKNPTAADIEASRAAAKGPKVSEPKPSYATRDAQWRGENRQLLGLGSAPVDAQGRAVAGPAMAKAPTGIDSAGGSFKGTGANRVYQGGPGPAPVPGGPSIGQQRLGIVTAPAGHGLVGKGDTIEVYKDMGKGSGTLQGTVTRVDRAGGAPGPVQYRGTHNDDRAVALGRPQPSMTFSDPGSAATFAATGMLPGAYAASQAATQSVTQASSTAANAQRAASKAATTSGVRTAAKPADQRRSSFEAGGRGGQSWGVTGYNRAGMPQYGWLSGSYDRRGIRR